MILQLAEAGDIELLSSEVLQFEIDRIPDAQRQVSAKRMLTLASEPIVLTDAIEVQAAAFVEQGIKPIDALHLASACSANASFFCTCDDRLLKKSKGLKDVAIHVVSPLQLLTEVSL
jgi:hypothetical protein